MPLSCTIDTDTCAPEDAERLKSLVSESGIMQSPSLTTLAACDARYYNLHIDDGEQSHSVKFDDINIPANVRPLIDFLQSRAKSVFGDDDA